MEFNSPKFRAPSIDPKERKKIKPSSSPINSPIIKSYTTIKVPQGMSYGAIRAATVDPKYLKKKETPVEYSLVETNNILLEIQKQLALDYSSRIAEKRNEFKVMQTASDKLKREKSEKNIESVNKLKQVVKDTTGKLLQPVKTIFDQLLGFFGNIGAGFLALNAIKWLDKNKDTVSATFEFLKNNWKTISFIAGGLFIGVVGRKLYKLFRGLRSVVKLLKGNRARTTTTTQTSRPGGGIFRNVEGQRRGKLTVGTESQSRIVPGKFTAAGGAARENVEVITRQKGIVNKALQSIEVGAKKMGRNIVKSLGMGPGQKTLQKTILKFARPILKKVPFIGAVLDFALSVALGENPGRAAFGAIGAGLLASMGTFLGGPIGAVIGGFAGDFTGRKLYDLFFGGKSVGESEEVRGMNRGGTVTGKDVGDKDSVPTYLTVGEKVIPREQSEKFAPFLDDIIYDGANLYKSMMLSFDLQNENNKLFLETNKKFAEFLDRYNQTERDTKGFTFGGGSSSSSSSLKKSSPSISPTSTSTPSLTTKKRKGAKGDNMIVAPAMGSNKTPTSSAMSSSAQGGDSVPILGAEDPSNFFVPFMKEQLGIFGA